MDKIDIDKIERIIKDREYSRNFFLNRHSKAYDSFIELEKSAYSSNRLERKYKELVALGISIIQNCESCIEWHVHQALEFGATFDEIFEALDVGIEMGGGPATVSARFAIKVMEYYKNQMMKELKSEQDFIECTEVIQRSFKTVADDFNLTRSNAPTHPSNLTLTALKESVDKGITFYGLYRHGVMVGCIGIEKSTEEYKYYIEKLAVLPDKRHFGYGKMLLDFACDRIYEMNGRLISIGIINENSILKNWYNKYGFNEKKLKRFDHLPFEVCFMEKEI
jgi:diamine N-acetyltransferase